jgi:uncharacterized protein (TIGR01244 family)
MIDARTLSDRFAVAPQIDPADCAALAAAGFVHLVNNRPDSEVPASHRDAAMAEAAAAVGLGYTPIPIDHAGLFPDQIERLAAVIDGAAGPVFAWCRSGTRSAFLWGVAEASRGGDPAMLVDSARAAGYDISSVVALMRQLREEADGKRDTQAPQG